MKLFTIIITIAISVYIKVEEPELDWNIIYDLACNYSSNKTLTSTSTIESTGVSKEYPLDGVVVVITGSTSGIGKGLTLSLCRLGATIIAIGRSTTKLNLLGEELKKEQYYEENNPSKIIPIVSNSNDFESVSNAANQISSQFSSVDFLINNAGFSCGFASSSNTNENDTITVQGYDLCFGVNYLSHVLLTEKLTPLLMTSKYQNSRIVFISSSTHWGVDATDVIPSRIGDDYLPKASKRSNNEQEQFKLSLHAYANSKLSQILYARSLSRKLKNESSTLNVINVCPSFVNTDIVKSSTIGSIFFKLVGFSPKGFGLSSTFNAMFRPNLGTLPNTDYVTNLYNPLKFLIPTDDKKWYYSPKIRSAVLSALGFFFVSVWQKKILYRKFQVTNSSPESYNVTIQDSLYNWSLNAVDKWL